MHAEDLTVTVEIDNIKINGGTVYVAIYNSSDSMRRERPFRQAMADDRFERAVLEFSMPPGDYVVSAYQDVNGNGKLDSNFLGIPREPVGLSNYSGGIPGNFDKLKTALNAGNRHISISMVEI